MTTSDEEGKGLFQFAGDKKAAFDAGFVMPSWQDAAERWLAAYDAEKALADDLALALGLWIKYGRPPVQAAEVMARYKAARGIEESRWEEVKVRSDAALARHKERHQ